MHEIIKDIQAQCNFVSESQQSTLLDSELIHSKTDDSNGGSSGDANSDMQEAGDGEQEVV